jgi:hypothetical protein
MDDRLRKLGELFEGSDVRWNLDGAMNISLVAGEYIGVHKDVDISVEIADLEKFDGLLGKHGYGMFVSHNKNEDDPSSPRILERVSAEKFAAVDAEHRTVVAIDEHGKINDQGNLNFIDVHLVTRDAVGRVVGPGGSVLPEKWSTPIKKEYQGHELNLSNPAKLAFFKLHESRAYDRTDLKKLVELGGLTLDDVKDIEEAFKEDAKGRYRKGEAFVASIATKIRPKMDARGIRDVFLADPAFAKRIRPEDEPAFLDFCAQVVRLEEKTPVKVTELAMEAFGANKKFKELRAKVAELRQWVHAAAVSGA